MTTTKKWLRWLTRFALGALVLEMIPLTVLGAEVRFKSDTLLRVFERDTVTEKDGAVVPAYEYLQLDIETPDEPGLSFHLYGWGRWDMADNDYYTDETAGELLYGYLEYTRKEARFNARLGRQYVFEGVANEAIDGLRISSDLGPYFSGSVYTGQPVALDSEEGRSGDSIYGGRLAHHLAGKYELGVSYKKIRNDSDDAEETAGFDLSAYLPFDMNLYGFSTYNPDSDGWGEHSYQISATLGPLSVRPYYQKFRYEDYFNTGANSASVFRFLDDTGEELTLVGIDLTLPMGDSWVLVAKAKDYDYQVLDDSSQYFAAQAIWSGEGHSQMGGEIGFMNGDAAQNDYLLLRLDSYWDQMPDGCPIEFVSGDVVYVDYDRAIYNEGSSLFVSLGLGKKFMEDALTLKVSGDYSSDPYFDDDLRGMLTASYRFGLDL